MMTTRRHLFLAALAVTLTLAPACDPAPPRGPSTAAATRAEPRAGTLAPGGAAGRSPSSEEAAAAGLDPEAARAALWALAPAQTRAGGLRFTDPLLERPEAAEVMLARLREAGAPAELRFALAEALPRCGGAWAAGAATQAAVEGDPAVRAVLMAGLRRATPEVATPALAAGLTDPAAEVRAAAAESAGWTPAIGAGLVAPLVALLSDTDAGVRAAATRALGLLSDGGSFAAVAGRLGDADAEVRLEAVRALGRIDGAQARGLAAMAAAAAEDADGRVRAAAARVQAGP